MLPLPELRRLQEAARRAPAELLEEAEIEATMAAQRELVTAGRPRRPLSRRGDACATPQLVKIEWSPAARRSARRYLADQDGMRAIGAAIAQLADNSYPPEAFHRGEYHRLRVGLDVVDDDLVTIERVDRLNGV